MINLDLHEWTQFYHNFALSLYRKCQQIYITENQISRACLMFLSFYDDTRILGVLNSLGEKSFFFSLKIWTWNKNWFLQVILKWRWNSKQLFCFIDNIHEIQFCCFVNFHILWHNAVTCNHMFLSFGYVPCFFWVTFNKNE